MGNYHSYKDCEELGHLPDLQKTDRDVIITSLFKKMIEYEVDASLQCNVESRSKYEWGAIRIRYMANGVDNVQIDVKTSCIQLKYKNFWNEETEENFELEDPRCFEKVWSRLRELDPKYYGESSVLKIKRHTRPFEDLIKYEQDLRNPPAPPETNRRKRILERVKELLGQ